MPFINGLLKKNGLGPEGYQMRAENRLQSRLFGLLLEPHRAIQPIGLGHRDRAIAQPRGAQTNTGMFRAVRA